MRERSYRWGKFQGWACLFIGMASIIVTPFGSTLSSCLAKLLVGILFIWMGVGLIRQTHYGIALFTLLALAASFSCFVVYGRAALYLPTIAWWVVPAIFYYPRRWSRAPSAASHPEWLLKRLIDVIRSSGFNRTRTE